MNDRPHYIIMRILYHPSTLQPIPPLVSGRSGVSAQSRVEEGQDSVSECVVDPIVRHSSSPATLKIVIQNQTLEVSRIKHRPFTKQCQIFTRGRFAHTY